MDTCLWNDKLVIANETSISYESEREIRFASDHKQLMCPDPRCRAVVIYRHGEKKEAHFAHLRKSRTCDYDEYNRSNNTYIKRVKSKLFNHLKNLGYNVQMDVKLLERRYTHLTVSFDDGTRIALELGTKSVTASDIEKIEKQYSDKNIKVRWIVIDDVETELKEKHTYHIKRSSLNESENKDLIVIDFKADKVAQYKLDTNKYQYNNFDYLPVSNQDIYQYVSTISKLIVLEKDITLLGFNELYEEWRLKKEVQLNSYIEKMKIEKRRQEELLNLRTSMKKDLEIETEVKHNNLRKPSIRTKIYKPDEEPFILENITVPLTKRALKRRIFHKWNKEDFKEKIKLAVDEDISAVKNLIGKIYECDENELSIFVSLLTKARAAPQNPKTKKCIKIMEHVLRQAKKDR